MRGRSNCQERKYTSSIEFFTSYNPLKSPRYSYKFIETSVRTGILQDLAPHAVGPPEGAVRAVGSVTRPPKGTRNKFTSSDDNILWDWVNTNPQKGGGTDGNEIYKQLEAKVITVQASSVTLVDMAQHPQHPWQSWRDRYIKYLKGGPRPFPLPHNAPPTPPLDQNASHEIPEDERPDGAKHCGLPFTDEDAQMLLGVGADIVDIDPGKLTDAWENWTREFDVSGNSKIAI